MKFISLFAGIGGFDLGLERAGMTCVAQVENNPYCLRVLEKHWPNVLRIKDVKDANKNNLPATDLICGGFPCQPHSLAGKRAASADDRDLWPEFARIVREIMPRWVLGENVPGLLSSAHGRFFGGILADLAASGYVAEWQSISAAAFGAPHIRERVFLVAHLPDSISERLKEQRQPVEISQKTRKVFSEFVRCGEWEVEPGMGRVVDGFPGRVDRLEGLGNAVTPQQAEFVGRCIMKYESEEK